MMKLLPLFAISIIVHSYLHLFSLHLKAKALHINLSLGLI